MNAGSLVTVSVTQEHDWLFENFGDAIEKDNIGFTQRQVALRLLI